jgi:hypothetical protein
MATGAEVTYRSVLTGGSGEPNLAPRPDLAPLRPGDPACTSPLAPDCKGRGGVPSGRGNLGYITGARLKALTHLLPRVQT